MSLEGPSLRYAREDDREDDHARALRLARQIEELLEATPSQVVPNGAHGTRMARALAASLVDELEGIVRGTKRANVV